MNTERDFQNNLTQNKFIPMHVDTQIREMPQIQWEQPTPKQPDPAHPFTKAEDEIMQYLLKAQVLFISLPGVNKNAATDFLSHTRDLRRILAMRIIAREFSSYEVESQTK
jgi:hypothetical protein